MANIKAAQKNIRTSERRRLENRKRKTEIKTHVRYFNEAIDNGNTEEAQELLKVIDRKVKKAVHQNIIHRNAGSRKISSLTKKLNSAM